ncbi:MAG TPA: hypothetical protein DGG95_06400 [Cytophagales bacterium]|jgi:hypothetical protein|nr:hypothetical protein [Cytophagales bacterium]
MKMRYILLFFLISTVCYSQDFRIFRFGIGLGSGSIAQESDLPEKSACSQLFLEPMFHLTNRSTLGQRIELSANEKSVLSLTLNYQYYLLKVSKISFRPFIGLGVGIYHPFLVGDLHKNFDDYLQRKVFGYYPRIGFDLGHFYFVVDWNVITPVTGGVFPYYGPSSGYNEHDRTVDFSYTTFKCGFFFGGGRKSQ